LILAMTPAEGPPVPPLPVSQSPASQAPASQAPAAPAPEVSSSAGGADETGPEVLFRQRSPVQEVLVVREDGLLTLRFDHVASNDQSAIDPKDPDRPAFEYVRLATTALLVAADRDALRRA